MRSPRLIYLAAAAVLAVAGFVLTQYLADRSAPGLGETVVVPAGSTVAPTPTPTVGPPSTGAEPVSPAHPRTAGDDDDRDDDGIDDDLDSDE
jgi:hypothetical protein